MTQQEKDILEEIHYSVSHAAALMDNLSQEVRIKIEEIHRKGYTLAYCLRWGEIAINDVRDEFDI